MTTAISKVSFIKKPYIEIEYIAEQEWLYINWKGKINDEMGMIGCEDILLALHKYPVKKIINDNRHVFGSWADGINNWLINSWFPRFLGAGCFFMAWVQSPCSESQASLEQALKYDIPNITILVFDDIETATSWLKEI
ncbi:hypothetical protein [Adhaeribacter radiodurans]|uniref:STAS/SEC14 domain-containing protein n=1 Tax=Adhaeribacter radiodurans TaxID=2745197 RepID=A0A7L7L8K8_9BACT|nr:hypothetical protein [Adhaeribacter radiodurans]QMU29073.1 hypothetical protein HUW48_13935 [Adhaeribacter radiodurans]